MPDTNVSLRRGDDEPDDTSIEEQMRLALGRLGTKASVGQGRPASTAASPQAGSQRRARFARDSEVPVERVTTSRAVGDGHKELAGEREAAMAGLRAELQRVAAERDALQQAQVAAAAQAKPRRVSAPPRAEQPEKEPEPVRWWLDYLKAPRS